MKILSIIFSVIFYSIVSHGQNQICFPINTLQQTHKRSEVFLHSDDVVTSVQRDGCHIRFTEYAEHLSQDNCIKYKKMKKTGTILASVGGGLLGAGIVLTGVGFSYTLYKANIVGTGYNGDASAPLIISGSLSLALGFAGVSSGIPLTVIGSKRMKKYCGENKSTMIFSTKGNSLILNF